MTQLTTLVTGISARLKTSTKAGKVFEMGMDIQLPGMRGIVSARQFGTMLAMELVDHCRVNWLTGKTILGETRGKSETATDIRKQHAQTLTSVSLDDNLGRKEKYVRGILKHYTLRTQSTQNIDGVKTKTKTRSKYVPDPAAPALNSSGLMIDSLKGAWVPGASTPVGQSGVVYTQGWIRLRVPASRNAAAYFNGGLRPENAARVMQIFSSQPQNFKYTTSLLNHFLEWEERPKQAPSAWPEVGRALSEMAKYITRI